MRINYFNQPTRKRFIDAFPKFKDETGQKTYFWEAWQQSPFFDETFTEEDLKGIYNHLLAKYYNWHYIYPDDLGIALNTMHTIHDYFPNVKERLSIVKQIREMGIEEFKKSGLRINSRGENPKVDKQMDELINLVDSQNAAFELKSQEQALIAKFASLYDGVMDEFIDRFKDQFVVLYNGVSDYVYENCEEEV